MTPSLFDCMEKNEHTQWEGPFGIALLDYWWRRRTWQMFQAI